MQGGLYRTDRCFDAVHARTDLAQVCQRRHQANGAVAAHAKVAGIVEENHSGAGSGVDRFAQQCADQHVAAPWFEHAGGAPLIMVFSQSPKPFGHAAGTQVGKTAGHQAGGFAASVGVDHGDAFHDRATSVQMSERKSGPCEGLAA
ncbi:hypothetical protein D9M71_666990 [compost metagenome]